MTYRFLKKDVFSCTLLTWGYPDGSGIPVSQIWKCVRYYIPMTSPFDQIVSPLYPHYSPLSELYPYYLVGNEHRPEHNFFFESLIFSYECQGGSVHLLEYGVFLKWGYPQSSSISRWEFSMKYTIQLVGYPKYQHVHGTEHFRKLGFHGNTIFVYIKHLNYERHQFSTTHLLRIFLQNLDIYIYIYVYI